MKIECEVAIGIFILLLGFGLGLSIGGDTVATNMRNDAIRHNVAKWEVNERTGDVKFVYITNTYNISTNK